MLGLLDTWRARHRIHRTRQQLHDLSDWTLSDIGLTRADIGGIGRDGLPGRHRR